MAMASYLVAEDNGVQVGRTYVVCAYGGGGVERLLKHTLQL